MASRFKKTGDYYVSQWGGDDSNAGTDPNLPFKTFAPLETLWTAGTTVVVGTGYYTMPNIALPFGNTKTLLGDGKVIIKFNSNGWRPNGITAIDNIQIIDWKTQSGGDSSTPTNCIYSGYCEGGGNGRPSSLFGNVWLPNNGIPYEIMAFTSGTNSIFLESASGNNGANPQGGGYILRGCYVSKNAIINQNANNTWLASSESNIFNGKMLRNGLLYESKQMVDGSIRPDADPNVLDLVTLRSDVYTANRFLAGDPKFIDIENRLVEPDSDLLKLSYGGAFVGAVKPAKYVPLSDVNFQFSYTNINTSNPNSVLVQSGQPDGEIRITGKISDSIVSSQFLSLRTLLAFNADFVAPSPQNNNVPDAVKRLGLLASEINKPRRLTYFMRTSLDANANQSSPIAIWDNDGNTVAGEWLLMEDMTTPQAVTDGVNVYGNGDPRGIGSPGTNLNFRAIDIRVVLDNQRNI